ncbi:phage tail domain-containing protein [Pontibacillus salipaludis]|uniref:Phage tail component-like protein n=1 Tax=Pontibacillus salipaludis TaxID=1697394 RepID=A0ABQ1PX44_9BACI|nr:phage tail domain-containing protein [Pontibacillus salipaludis]GGD05452.1 hypothetical protein GCM10011389_11200 [Pontibacillus salipaludis]
MIQIEKSELNFLIEYKDGSTLDIADLGLWVEYFHIYSPNAIREKVEAPGKDGAYVASTKIGERTVSIGFQIETNSLVDFDALKHQVYKTFYAEEAYKIIRDITPDKYIYIYQEGDYDIEQITPEDGEFGLDLSMFDPYTYGTEEAQILNDPLNPEEANSVIDLKGDKAVLPKYRVTFLEPSTFLSIATPNDLFMLGAPYDIDETSYNPYPIVLDDNMGDLTEWGENGLVPLDNGVVASNFNTDGQRFFVTSFGSGSNWHGPAARKDLTRSLDKWLVDVSFQMKFDSADNVGRIELYLIADDGSTLGKLSIKDTYEKANNTKAEIRIGDNSGEVIASSTGYRPGSYNNNVIRLVMAKRDENVSVHFGEITSGGRYLNGVAEQYVDDDQLYNKRLAAVQIHAGAKGSRQPPQQASILDLTVKELAEKKTFEAPYIATAGDVIWIDCQKQLLLFNGREQLLNGDSAMSLRNMYTDFFPLTPGMNSLGILPSESVKVEAVYQPKYL